LQAYFVPQIARAQLPSKLIADIPPPLVQIPSLVLAPGDIESFSIGINETGTETFLMNGNTVSNTPINFTVTPFNYDGAITIQSGLLPLTFGSGTPIQTGSVTSETGSVTTSESTLILQLLPVNPTIKLFENKLLSIDARYGTQSELNAGGGTKLVFPLNSILWQHSNLTIFNMKTNGTSAQITGVIPGESTVRATLTMPPSNIDSMLWNQLLSNRIDTNNTDVPSTTESIFVSTKVTVSPLINLSV
jgi:hypothetical protein